MGTAPTLDPRGTEAFGTGGGRRPGQSPGGWGRRKEGHVGDLSLLIGPGTMLVH